MRTDLLKLLPLCAALALGGCATPAKNPKDPLESFNRGMYKFNDTVDKAVVKPLAKGYKAAVPPPARMMASNFFSNLNDVVVAVNDLLQFKVKQAASDTGRIVVNTTVGMFGLVDVATAVGLEKHNEDFGQTLGKWGINSGPYLVLPLLGPSSFRDGVGLYADSRAGTTRRIKHISTRNQLIAANALGKRASLLDREDALEEAAIDRYAFIRDSYLQHRQSLVYDGNPPRRKYEDEDYEDEEPADKPSSHDSSSEANSVPVQPVAEAAAPEPVAVESEPVATEPEPVAAKSAPQVQRPPTVLRIWVSGR